MLYLELPRSRKRHYCNVWILWAKKNWSIIFRSFSKESNVRSWGRVRLGSIRNKNNWNNASKRLFGSYSHSGIPGFPFRLFCSQEQNNRNIIRNIMNEWMNPEYILIPEYPKRTRPEIVVVVVTIWRMWLFTQSRVEGGYRMVPFLLASYADVLRLVTRSRDKPKNVCVGGYLFADWFDFDCIISVFSS